MIHRLAQSYGKWPHEVLRMELWDLNFNAACLMAGDLAVMSRIKKINQAGGMAVPVVQITG